MPDLTTDELRTLAWRGPFDPCKTCDKTTDHRCRTASGALCPPHEPRMNAARGWVARQGEVDGLTEQVRQLGFDLQLEQTEYRLLDEALDAAEAAREDALQAAADWARAYGAEKTQTASLAAQVRNLRATTAALAAEVNQRDQTIATLTARIADLEHPKRALTFGVGLDVVGNVESLAGAPVGYHRTYWTLGGGVHGAAVSQAKADLAAGRTPVLSFKIPGNDWAGAAAGIYDARLRATCETLAALDGIVIVCVHHEPEGDGPLDVYRAMTARLVDVVKVGDVQFWQCGTGYHQLYGASEWKLNAFYVPGVDGIGFDPYQSYGASSTKWIDQTAKYYKPFGDFAREHGVQWGIFETGVNEQAITSGRPEVATWFADCAAGAEANGATCWCVFNSETTKDGKHDWRLTTTGANKQAQMVAVVKKYAR